MNDDARKRVYQPSYRTAAERIEDLPMPKKVTKGEKDIAHVEYVISLVMGITLFVFLLGSAASFGAALSEDKPGYGSLAIGCISFLGLPVSLLFLRKARAVLTRYYSQD